MVTRITSVHGTAGLRLAALPHRAVTEVDGRPANLHPGLRLAPGALPLNNKVFTRQFRPFAMSDIYETAIGT